MSLFSNYPKKKKLYFFLLSFLLFSCLFFIFSLPKPKLSFQELTNRLFFEDVTMDTLSLHYTLAHPSHYSIDSYPLTLPKYNPDTIKQTYSRIENILIALQKINTSQLSHEELYCHLLLTNYFSMQKEGFSFTYFEEYFSPSSGIPANFPILMAEYTFRTKQDVTDYLALLTDTPNYFTSFFEFQKERAKKGHQLAQVSLQETIEQCDTIITQQSLSQNSHFLQLTFRERLSVLVAKNIISKTEAFQYIEKNNSILRNIVLPAFQELKSRLATLQTSDTSLAGLYRAKKGKDYYSWLVQKQTGTSFSVPEILNMLESDYQKNLLEFQALQKKLSAFGDYEKLMAAPFPITDRNDLLEALQNFTQKDFPSLSAFSDRPLNTTIKSVSSCMEDYTSPAFYLIPPIDDIWQNTIYINTSSTPEGLDLFTTLAHEGFPGHLYQTVYYQLYSSQNFIPFIRHLMNYSGYVEGWAIYSEFYAYEYATNLYPKEVQNFYSLWHRLLLCDRKLQLAILSILDIKLHYYDDSFATVQSVLMEYGITDKETLTNIHQYILEEPANYLTYYVGYLCFANLKEKARTLLGSDFTDLKFHQFVLEAGPSDFPTLEKRMLNRLNP